MPYINPTNISTLMQVFLLTDNYDHNPDPLHISATTLLKPTKEIILGASNKVVKDIDIKSFITSRSGSAIHDAVEKAWKTNYKKALLTSGYSIEFIEKIVINPTDTENITDKIPVYFEKRSSKKLGKWTVSGKFDNVFDGIVSDIKNTSTYTYVKKTSDKDYAMQGGIYKWLNPDIITGDHIFIEYVFGDWKPYEAAKSIHYPPHKIMSYKVMLPSLEEVESYITNKLADIEAGILHPESIKDCTSKELWLDPSVFKYYVNPQKTLKSSGNFNTYAEALEKQNSKGGIGIIKEIKSLARKCNYCSALGNCHQAERLKQLNLLKLEN